jgi:hypothetical protein
VDEFVRGSALRSLSVLVHQGALARADVVAYLADLFRDKLEKEYSHVRDVVVSEALNLHATTLAEDIRAGYEAGLIDPGYVHPTSVERGFAMTEDAALARAKRRCGGLIDDVIREMHWWACFQPGGSSHSEAQLEFQPMPDRPESEMVVRSAPKVGQNAPCPCGSGRKYKKCCGK